MDGFQNLSIKTRRKKNKIKYKSRDVMYVFEKELILLPEATGFFPFTVLLYCLGS